MFKSVVYHGDSLLGEVEVYPQKSHLDMNQNKEYRISHLSPPSERCPPLAVLHTIAAAGVCFKMEFNYRAAPLDGEPPLSSLHTTCLRENKTAVINLREEEVHLVAMSSRKNLELSSYFWGFNVMPGLYNSCLVMLNIRCLGIVFDLDETLVVANTMRSFEDRIDALQRKISGEVDPQRISGMLAEVKRYQDDKNILKQYADNDQVVEDGRVVRVQTEMVPPLSDSHPSTLRPLIRLQEKNIILTRINPQIRDTSVLVRLRPAWEDLRSYLIARGRKRFEVYVCTMAERDYALEMWRLLDPEFNLINPRELLSRIVCVKSGLKKSLFNVFQDGNCHPKMALVIDDRLKVWEEADQARVHVVPAFAPYYAPQAEGSNVTPVLCVARNVACSVRGGFFNDFDDGLLQQLSDVKYEDDTSKICSAPDVSNYLITEDDNCATNGNRDPLSFDGMADAEVERRLKEAMCNAQSLPVYPIVNNMEPRLSVPASLQSASGSPLGSMPLSIPLGSLQNKPYLPSISPIQPLAPGPPSELTLQGSPAREEGEVPESELDPDTRRRLLILQHGQDSRDHAPSELPPPPPPPPPPFPAHPPPVQMGMSSVQPRGGYFPLEEDTSPRRQSRGPKEFALETEAFHFEKHRSNPPSFYRGSDFSDRVGGHTQFSKQQMHREDDFYHTHQNYRSFSGEEMHSGRSLRRELSHESDKSSENPANPVVAVRQIAIRCGAKVEFRSSLVASTELQFLIEVWFVSEKIGEGVGRTRKEAQRQAAESSLRSLADRYLSRLSPELGEISKISHATENGTNDRSSFRHSGFSREESLPPASTSEHSRIVNQGIDGSNKSLSSVSALKELCTVEGLSLIFRQLSLPRGPNHEGEVYAEAEVRGQVLGKGSGLTWEDAKLQAAEEALGNLNTMIGQFATKRPSSPRLLLTSYNKRQKSDFPRSLQRMPSSRYARNALSSVP